MNMKFEMKPMQMKIKGEGTMEFEGAVVELTDVSLPEYVQLVSLIGKQRKELIDGLPELIGDIGDQLMRLYKENEEFSFDMAKRQTEYYEEKEAQHSSHIHVNLHQENPLADEENVFEKFFGKATSMSGVHSSTQPNYADDEDDKDLFKD